MHGSTLESCKKGVRPHALQLLASFADGQMSSSTAHAALKFRTIEGERVSRVSYAGMRSSVGMDPMQKLSDLVVVHRPAQGEFSVISAG